MGNLQHAIACWSTWAKAKRRWKEKKVMFGLCFVALMAQLVWRHSCGVDRLPGGSILRWAVSKTQDRRPAERQTGSDKKQVLFGVCLLCKISTCMWYLILYMYMQWMSTFEPRLYHSFINITEKRKIVMKTSRYKGPVLGSFLAPKIGDLWRRSCGPLVRGQRGVFVWCWCASTVEQRSWRCFGLKTGPWRHRIQFVKGPVSDPRAKETCFEKGSESEPL